MGEAAADALRDLLFGAAVSVTYVPDGAERDESPSSEAVASATAPGPPGWRATVTIALNDRVARLVGGGPTALGQLLRHLPAAALRAAAQLRTERDVLTPALRRAVRDTVASEILRAYLTPRIRTDEGHPPRGLVAGVIDYLIEVSGSRVEAHDLTHGVVIADVLDDVPRLVLRYPDDLRAAKRAPLLFDGRRSVLLVDPLGRARTEIQRHRFERLAPRPAAAGGDAQTARSAQDDAWTDSGSLVAAATAAFGGVGFYVRGDRSIWTFVDGQPLLVRRGEHWTAFPVELSASIANMIGGGRAADVVARVAYMISSRPQGAILAIVDDAASIDGVVSLKDRFDLRNGIDPTAMRPETRLHHLIDAADIDEHTLARLAGLDGATILDRDAQLIAYGAIVTTTDSEHEGARTAAARTLSESALVVLKVSVDGDITIFRGGAAVTTLLGHPAQALGV
ncbi:MAG TPA: hypothetical protein VM345_16625 [Acidimicrobiales bacterium]|nr:hypothetical protein [Acidimicrobiales bacterium]